MSKILLLDQNTINKIAAGEVVERPASIVKELVENSIDAGATAVTVEIKEGGMSSIRITDNGAGIDPADIRHAFLRHSTSKIRAIDDLLTVASLGFRGEALASIASISQVELITKTYEHLTGIRYIIEGGNEKSMEEIGCPEGTTFIIQNIFFNTPARRKFLKSQVTEAAYISELINKLALSNPQISFKFINNGQVKLHTSGNNKLLDCIFTVFNKEIAKNLIEIHHENEDLSLKGFIGKPVISRANRNYENYYINGRYIKSKVIQKAIEDAYKSKLTVHQYPFSVFDIRILSEYIDVNVHPTKMEIRFNNEQVVYDCIYGTLLKALNQTELIPQVSFDSSKETNRLQPVTINSAPEPFEKSRIQALYGSTPITSQVHESITASPLFIPFNTKAVGEMVLDVNREMKSSEFLNTKTGEIVQLNVQKPNSMDEKRQSLEHPVGEQLDYRKELFTSPETAKEHKIIGQMFKTYWIIEFKEKYYIIDQHAAHERVLYEKIIGGLKEKNGFSQGLLQPLIVHLSMKEKLRYCAHQQLFADLGFDIEEFGGEDLAIRAVPFIFDKPLSPNDFTNILDRLDDEYKEEKYDILLDEVASMSCKAAVKANDKMSDLEYHQLIDQLLALENPFNCPHGRPTIISMTKYELEKKFKRIQ